MICSSNYKPLKEAKIASIEKLRRTIDEEERFALFDYSKSLDNILDCNSSFIPDFKDELILFCKFFSFDFRTKQYDLMMANGFIEDLDYHRFLLKEVANCMIDSKDYVSEKEDVTEDEDFVGLLREFMSSLGLDDLLSEFLDKRRIINYTKLYDDTKAFILHNNIDDEAFICVRDFNNSISSINTLVHELGHAYDARNSFQSLKTKNDYFYISLLSEIIPYTFERLFVNYLLQNNIYNDEAKKVLQEINYNTYKYSFLSYVFSLSDPSFLIEHISTTIRGLKIREDVLEQIKNDFSLKELLNNSQSFNLRGDCKYAYGYIVSLYLMELINDNSMPDFDCIFRRRDGVFDISLMEELNINPDSFALLTQKEKQLLKK